MPPFQGPEASAYGSTLSLTGYINSENAPVVQALKPAIRGALPRVEKGCVVFKNALHPWAITGIHDRAKLLEASFEQPGDRRIALPHPLDDFGER
jgi:hypothetical protein